MNSDINKVYILTPVELTVIAAAKNISEIFSMQNEDNTIDETAVCQALNHMYQQQFISNAEDEGFVLDDELRELITVVEQAKTAVLLRYFADKANIKVIYIGDRLVAMEQRETDLSSVRIYEIPEKELEIFLQDDISDAEKPYRNILDEKRIISEGMKKETVLQDGEIEVMGNIVTLVERIVLQGNKVTCRMLAKQDKEWLRYRQDEKKVEFLKENEFLDKLAAMIREDFYDIS